MARRVLWQRAAAVMLIGLPLAVRDDGFDALVGHLFITLEGIFGVPVDVSATLIVLFCIFGAFLQHSGAGKFFIDFSLDQLRYDYPDEPDPRVTRAYAYLQRGRIDPAIEDFQWVVARYPGYSDAWVGLGHAYERTGELA